MSLSYPPWLRYHAIMEVVTNVLQDQWCEQSQKMRGLYRTVRSHRTLGVACGVKGLCATVYKELGAETGFRKPRPGTKDKTANVTYLKLY